jgi:hypothetical protein
MQPIAASAAKPPQIGREMGTPSRSDGHRDQSRKSRNGPNLNRPITQSANRGNARITNIAGV